MLVETLLGPLGRLLVVLVLEVQLRDGLGALVDLLGGMNPLFSMRSNTGVASENFFCWMST